MGRIRCGQMLRYAAGAPQSRMWLEVTELNE
jgi:hypothetical protein